MNRRIPAIKRMGLQAAYGSLLILTANLASLPHGEASAAEPAASAVIQDKDPMDMTRSEEASDPGVQRAPLPLLPLSEAQIQQQGLTLAQAGPGRVATSLNVPGKIVINGDHLAHVVPRVAGVVREVHITLGAQVKAGDVLAVIDSRELADATAAYLGSIERRSLTQVTFNREMSLWQQKISATQDYLNAKNALAEASIEARAAEQKLLALGFKPQELTLIARNPERVLSRYPVPAPFSGTVIEKDISLGEALEANATICVVADLSTVWADLSIFPQDLAYVHAGDNVTLSASGNLETAGKIAYVQPIVSEATRRTFARVILDNHGGQWRPGLFVNAQIAVAAVDVPVLVPRAALQPIENSTVAFVRSGEGIEPRWVTVGRSNDTHAEILHGLRPGETYVASGTFILKAELEKNQIQ